MKNKIVSIVAAAALTFLAVAPVLATSYGPPQGTGSTDVYVQNTSLTTQATVVVQYYDSSGNAPVGPISVPVNAGASGEFLASASGLGAGFSGAVVVSSDQDVAAAAVTAWTNIPQSTRAGQYEIDAYQSINAGANIQYIPGLVMNPGNSGTEAGKVSVQNTTGSPAVIYLNWNRRGQSTPDAITTDTLPAYTSHFYDTAAPNGTTVPDLPSFVGGSPNAWTGSVVVTSTSAIVAALSDQFKSYSGQNPATTTPSTSWVGLVYPRRYQTGSWRENGIVTLQNPQSSAATVRIDIIDKVSGTISKTINTTINAYDSVGINAKQGCGGCSPVVSAADLNVLGGDPTAGDVTFAGTVSVTSNLPIVGIVTLKQDFNNQGDIYSLVDRNGTNGKKGYVPFAVKVGASTSATYYSRVNIANMSNIAATVVISFYNTSGTFLGAQAGSTNILPGSIKSINMRGGGDLVTAAQLDTILGTGTFKGSMVINSTQPIAVLADELYSNAGVLGFATYNGSTR